MTKIKKGDRFTLRSQKIIKEECDHHWITDVQLGDYVECELCGLIFPKTELKRLRYNEKEF